MTTDDTMARRLDVLIWMVGANIVLNLLTLGSLIALWACREAMMSPAKWEP
jgi:hypothetical protein